MSTDTFHQLLSPNSAKKKKVKTKIGYNIGLLSDDKALLNDINEILTIERQDKISLFESLPDIVKFSSLNEMIELCELVIIDIKTLPAKDYKHVIEQAISNIELTKKILFIGNEDSFSIQNYVNTCGATYC
ncbi:hypothetical protein L1D34_30200, partial [Vibrio mediterranei]|uniref:hypothetical protein n=1 Tax=Vibrio mediterranei TaxID=689 RepID=UPI001EFD3E4F